MRCRTPHALLILGLILLTGRTWAQPAGISGSGYRYRAVLQLSSCGTVNGPVTLYLGAGACSDPTEAAVLAPVKNQVTFSALSCRLSGSTGSATLAVTARSGPCASLGDSTFGCTMGAGTQVCETTTATLTVAAGECVSFKAVASGAFPAPRQLVCTLERAG